MLKITSYLIFLLSILSLIYTQPVEENKNNNDKTTDDSISEPKYGVPFHVYGLFLIILSSAIGTILPMVLNNTTLFSVKGTLFNSLKMFGTGVIVTVAFVHMLSPADKMLSGDDAPEFFRENYDAFSGVFAITGIIIAHGIQLLVKEFFKYQEKKNNRYSSVDDGQPKNNEGEIGELNHSHSTESDSLLSGAVTNYDSYNSPHHNHEYNCHEHLDDDNCGHSEALLLASHNQIVSYLLEIGISLHSILIGFAFGTNFDNDINFLLIALMIHQFFEGIALSTIFIEAKFKNILAPLIMVVFYSITMPLGGIGGLIVYSFNHTNTVTMTCIQGVLDSIAAGLLIYDSLVNILSHYTSSKNWDSMGKFSKCTQLFSFYFGCMVMALIGIWA